MTNPEMEQWEAFLKQCFDEIDRYLENEYGNLYPLHPSRPARGETSNSSRDGLFNVGAAFTAGYGSRYGRGWVIEVDMVTLARVPRNIQEQIEEDTVRLLREKIDQAYPDNDIRVEKDGRAFKIFGDMGLKHQL